MRTCYTIGISIFLFCLLAFSCGESSNNSLRDDAPTPGIKVSSQNVSTSEGGAQTVLLINAIASPDPGKLLVIDILSEDVTEGTVSPFQIIFDETNWQVQKSFTLTPQDDAIYDGPQTYNVTLDPSGSTDPDYAALETAVITVQNADNETGFAAQGSQAGPIDLTGFVPYEGMVDDTASYYFVSVIQGDSIKVALTGYSENILLAVFDGDDTFTDFSCTRYNDPEFYRYCPVVVETSSLYIKVTNSDYQPTGTNFTISVEPVNAANYYIETMPNASGNTAHTYLQILDVHGHVIAVNDSGGYVQRRLTMESGGTYYFRISDTFAQGGYYSFRVGDGGFTGSSIGAADAPDQYEPDGCHINATVIQLNTIQDHSLFPIRESDCFVFTAP